MASVAKCPQCEHELLIPDGADLAAWAKCPACSAFFQLEEVSLREVAKPILVDSDFAPLKSNDQDEADVEALTDEHVDLDWHPRGASASARTLADFATPVEEEDVAAAAGEHADEPAQEEAELHQADVWFKHKRVKPRIADIKDFGTAEDEASELAADERLASDPIEEPGLSESAEVAAVRIEKWFRSADTIPDLQPIVPEDRAGAGLRPLTGEIAHDAELEQMLQEGAKHDEGDIAAESDNVPGADAQAEDELESYELDEAPVDANARTLADFSPPEPVGRPGATLEFSADTLAAADDDFELDGASGKPQNTRTWDDSEHMERLLADADPKALEPIPPVVHQSVTPAEPHSGEDDATTWMMNHPPRAPRRRSVVRTLLTTVVGGLFGLAVGYYVWLLAIGPRGDFMEVAKYLPSMLLPASFPAMPSQLTNSTMVVPQTEKDPLSGNRPEVPARFDAEVKPTSEPSQFEEPPAASPLTDTTTPATTHAVANASSYSADELAVALRAAQDAMPGLVAGALSDGKAVQQTKGKSYSALSDLAEKLTFVDMNSRADYVTPLARDGEKLFREILSNVHTREEMARIAPVWIGSPNRHVGGVFFAGSLTPQASQGPIVECQVDLGGGTTITVLVNDELATHLDAAGKPMAIIGSIIDDPAQRVTGYHGSAKQAVWVKSLIPLE